MHIVTKKKGYTLIETVVSLIILLIVLLGIFRATAYYAEKNTKNIIRQEAAKIAQACAENLRRLIPCNSPQAIQVGKLDLSANVTYPDISSISSGNTTSITITVTYEYPKGHLNQYTLKTIITKR